MPKYTDISTQSEDTTTGGSAASIRKVIHLLGYSDTQLDAGIFDAESSALLAQVSLTTMGNTERQARKGQSRVVYNQFGRASSRAVIHESQANTEKSHHLSLGNVLGVSNLSKPRGP